MMEIPWGLLGVALRAGSAVARLIRQPDTGTQALKLAYERAVKRVVSRVPTPQRAELQAGLLDEIVRREIERAETEHVEPNLGFIRSRLGARAVLNLNVEKLIKQLRRQWELMVRRDAAAAAVVMFMSRSRPAEELRGIAPPQNGETRQLSASVAGIIENDLARMLEIKTELLEASAHTDIERLQALWREGRTDEVHSWLERYNADVRLRFAYGPKLRAKIFRFNAAVLLGGPGDASDAENLLVQAKSLDPEHDYSVYDALIAHRAGRDAEALSLLTNGSRAHLNLAGAIHVYRGDWTAATEALALGEGRPPQDAETHRLRALVALAAADLDEGEREIEQSLRLAPGGFEARVAAALLSFARSVPGTRKIESIPYWPQPVPVMRIRDDRHARQGLLNAADQFRQLADASPTAERRRMELWRAAALLDSEVGRQEGAALLAGLIESDQTDPLPVLWALARGVDFDRRTVRSALEGLGALEANQVAALAELCVEAGDPGQALAAIEAYPPADEAGGEVVAFHRCRLLAVTGEVVRSLEEAEVLPERERWALKAIVARESPGSSDENLLAVLDSAHAATGDFGYVLEAAERRQAAGDWPWIADQLPTVRHSVERSFVVWLFARALLHTGRAGEAVQVLEAQLARGVLPGAECQLRKVRAHACSSLGRVDQAIRDMEWVVEHEETTTNQLILTQLYIDKGDVRGLERLAERLLSGSDLPNGAAISLAGIVSQHDTPLAKRLWRRAISGEMDDDEVVPAYTVGVQLGLDHEAGPLFARIAELAQRGHGSIAVFSIDDFPAFARERGATISDITEAYDQGRTPIHVVSEHVGESIGRLFHTFAAATEHDLQPLSQFALRIRHGGRTEVMDLTGVTGLRMDVTTLAFAGHLEFLDEIEEAFSTIRVAHSTPKLLLQMTQSARHHQPSQVEVARTLSELVAAGRVAVRDPISEPGETESDEGAAAEPERELVVVFGSQLEPGGAGNHRDLISVWAVVEALGRAGALTAEEQATVLDRIGAEAQSGTDSFVPPLGTRLHFTPGTLDILAPTTALREIWSRFSVAVPPISVTRWRAELDAERRGEQDAQWLTELSGRLRRGLEEGRYRLVPEIDAVEVAGNAGPAVLTLLEVLKAPSEANEAVCVDDRFVAHHLSRSGLPTVDAIDLLWALRNRGVLSESAYYEKLLRLRAANARFVPLDSAEIVYHLSRAAIREGEVIESRALGILRRYIAACLMDRGRQAPDLVNRNLGEIPFAFGVTRAVDEALIELWRDPETDPADAAARAEWIRQALFQDLGLSRLNIFPEDPVSLEVAAVGLMAPPLRAVTLISIADGNADISRAEAFTAWFTNRILEPRLNADPQLGALVGRLLTERLQNLSEPTAPEVTEQAAVLLAHLLLKSLPETVRELVGDRSLMDRLGFRVARTISDGQSQFVLEEFADAAARAMRGETSTIQSFAENPEEFGFTPDGTGGFRYMGPDSTPRQAGPELQVLSDDPVILQMALERRRELLDLPPAEVERVIADVAASAPTERLIALQDAVARSMSFIYRRLDSHLRNRERLPYEELLPADPTSVLHHLRLTPGEQGEFLDRWEAAIGAAIAELPLEDVLDRVLGLPVSMPSAVIDRLLAASPKEVRQLVNDRLPIRLTPVSAIASLQLLMALAKQTPWCGRLGRGLARRLLRDTWQEDGSAFGDVLSWTEHELRGEASFTQLMPVERLAVVWYHAHRLYSAFRTVTGAAQIEEAFRPSPSRVSESLFDRAPDYWNDRAHPRHYASLRFTLAGIVAAADDPEALPLAALHRALERLLETRRPEKAALALELFRDLSRTHNGLGAYVAPDPREFAPFAGSVIRVHSTAELTEACREALARIGQDSMDPEPWQQLIVILGDQAVDPILAAEFHRTAGSTDLISLAETNDTLLGLALSTIVTHYTSHGTAEERDALQERIRMLAERREGVAGGEELASFDWALIEATARLSLGTGGPEDSIRMLARQLDALVSSSPRLGTRSLHAVQRFCFELPIHLAQVFTPLLTRLRASVASLD
jgi:hypothetical protein